MLVVLVSPFEFRLAFNTIFAVAGLAVATLFVLFVYETTTDSFCDVSELRSFSATLLGVGANILRVVLCLGLCCGDLNS